MSYNYAPKDTPFERWNRRNSSSIKLEIPVAVPYRRYDI